MGIRTATIIVDSFFKNCTIGGVGNRYIDMYG